MTDNEKAVMTDCYRFLSEFGQPPVGDPTGFWSEAAGALQALGEKHRNHPLAVLVGTAVYEYIEEKWKAMQRRMR